ncbi:MULTISPECIES: Hsp20/alpha crystallin family protein [Terrabacteria group]|uniref:Hsp20/alpha crystallin family protein n=1 Tax=Bacillati TaxID=1783272 RepID=UPI00193AD716|nr:MULTISPECIES: Hsp20/alpha crystallin family protein [Terrabacteria group]MBW9212498.1 Hsp20/alpha crystallin family protein [Trueperella sp. zg.1013]QRG86746.1 Hsp20/alpha crystallin family protein [Bulleidia sp. zg-1006]
MNTLTRRNSFEELFDDMFGASSMNNSYNLMKTDVHEKDGQYLLDMEIPGVKKEDIKVSLFNGNLTVEASRSSHNEEIDNHGKVIRQERFSGTTSRTFYVGTAIDQSDIKVSYDSGVLHIELPTEKQKETDTKKFIEIL